MWDKVATFLSFSGIEDKTVWQDVILSSFLIPLVIFLGVKLSKWCNSIRPSRLIFKDYLSKNSFIYIFHSQMSGADDDWNFNKNQKYIARYPDPTPTDYAHLGIQKKLNIDPVSSGADSECVADIFNILGLIQKTKNIIIGDLINDWSIWSKPIFSVGFNPKTNKLIEKCDPIFFELSGTSLKVKNTNISYGSNLPDDAGVIQKTIDKDSGNPVFILAGIGTLGTSEAGFILKNNFIKLGKLFGNDPFCVFLTVKTNEGKNSALIRKIVPSPKWYRIFMFPILYFNFKNKDFFKY
ncbi:MAG: hypothetical protein COV31_01175 [Candidatus Yanofskybacteria bacterium CG10_big_fil_rev_8_21_14_0_10_46_23]|uniref:Uncharacterized protein n=1 Tax=Candidatus Yanofskybacteria bacterium CG10_big_fil_rev_8_21_14_0_10_46_23 TaxID=1975098 RepID=A0A2H0R4L9_9BACT|nr:MAG: hypothetical protein COV31_01175 [Candidatus Yanofskybacteria bacterium CG10_big_fil_rev_8_21_14_0_10_46_23]